MGNVFARLQQQAGDQPNAIAVRGEITLTYSELIAAVTRMRAALPVRSGQVVAIDAPSPVAGLIPMLAVLAADAVFLPLDQTAPAERRSYILADAGVTAVVTGDQVEVVTDQAAAVLDGGGYLLYTSGSTGRPKGVLVSEAALADRLDGLAARLGFGPGSSILALTAVSFDISLAELILPVYSGGTVVAAQLGARLDGARFSEVLAHHRPTVVQATPSFYRLMAASGWATPAPVDLWCGGEALTMELASTLVSRSRAVWNLYGPTEATIWASAWPVRPGALVELGDPLPGTTLELVDSNGSTVRETGVAGEIVLAGAGIASGYRNARPADAARFSVVGEPPVVRYMTGDRARYRPDGSLEFLGRLDAQVKLRGHRIELGEIEAALQRHPDVVDCAAFGRALERSDSAHIAVVVAVRNPITERELRRFLRSELPTAFMPKIIEVRRLLPRSPAGKLDRPTIEASLGPDDSHG